MQQPAVQEAYSPLNDHHDVADDRILWHYALENDRWKGVVRCLNIAAAAVSDFLDQFPNLRKIK